jgi:hypothetical protein
MMAMPQAGQRAAGGGSPGALDAEPASKVTVKVLVSVPSVVWWRQAWQRGQKWGTGPMNR